MADTQKTLTCPACGKQMEKVFIPSEGINLDICTEGCGGIYFDNREFKEFDEKNEDISKILEKLEGKTFETVDETLTRHCPNCGGVMVKNHSSIKQDIQMDDAFVPRFLYIPETAAEQGYNRWNQYLQRCHLPFSAHLSGG